ncbi:alpha-N-arabinofuranosidase [Demequina sp. NBRC 110055]|uniref:arabinosylfuranosidase ArfA n=1 Tax=Demequina sp. NBRC 110055 TaxID=1570344 RepID=UPI000A00FC1D|nr:alpha-N-arabinofuranosidase [Demequina sp. NBRC 110055]
MHHARLTIHPDFVVGPVRRGTFGTFVEHLGRCVYTGIFEPGHPTADDQGFRGDVLALVKELGVSTVRYPGGNFVSGYRWEDGIGPVEDRPLRLDLAWHSTEPNTFGLNEFMAWTKASGTEAMMAVNLGTRGIQETLDVLEYSNGKGDTHHAALRREHGVEEPHGVTFWCLGNEMDGKWQLGAKTAREYGRLASETARGMRQMYPDLTLVACGSSGSDMPTFGTWEREVLEECFDEVDLISAHAYYRIEDGDLGSFLASAQDMDHFIDAVSATADSVAIAKKSSKRVHISFDEWNVWYHDLDSPTIPKGDDWPVAPPLEEDNYSVADAVVVGNLLITLLRHTDRVHSASQAQLVNAIAPITTEPGGAAWRQTIFHPFALTAAHARGEVLRVAVDAPSYDNARFGQSALVDAVATYDRESGEVVVFAVNRATEDSTRLELDLASLGELSLIEAVTYANDDPFWRASKDTEADVLPAPNASATVTDGALAVDLPAVSWSMIRLGGASS